MTVDELKLNQRNWILPCHVLDKTHVDIVKIISDTFDAYTDVIERLRSVFIIHKFTPTFHGMLS